MGLTHFPHGVSSFGVPVMGSAANVPFTTGTYFFVDSATGSDSNDGLDKDHPFATIDYAVGQCTSNKGDVILVMPNHAETLTTAAAIDLDKEGIYVVGLGQGDNRPAITVATSTGADIDVDADSITISNFYFDLTGVDALTALIDVNDHHCTIENCEFLQSDSGGQAEDAIKGDANADQLKVVNCRFIAGTACSQSCVHMCGASTSTEVAHCWFDGDWNKGVVHTTAAATQINIHHNYIKQDGAEGPFDLGATAGGALGCIAYNIGEITDTAAGEKLATAVGDCFCFENYFTIDSSVSGKLLPPIWAS